MTIREALPSSKSCRTSSEHGRSIAVTGKGGTGKTMLATLMIKILSENGNYKILAIDADSAVSLPYTLGRTTGKTVSDIRREIIEVPESRRSIADQHIRTVMKSILTTGKSFDLLIMGRPEEPGCFCAVNDLLRYGIDTLIQDYHVTIIDCEAGPEQANRRVLKSIDTLLVVADMSTRSLQTASTIVKVVRGHGSVQIERVGLILNRLQSQTSPTEEITQQMGIEILGCIPEDQNVNDYDGIGRPLLELPEESPSLKAVRLILKQIM